MARTTFPPLHIFTRKSYIQHFFKEFGKYEWAQALMSTSTVVVALSISHLLHIFSIKVNEFGLRTKTTLWSLLVLIAAL